jgi:hypothetical protein
LRAARAAASTVAIAILATACSSSGSDPSADDSAAPDPTVTTVTTASAAPSSAAAASPSSAAASASSTPTTRITLPPVAAKFDYQLGGAYTPPAGVKIVSRDSSASPVPGIYNVCYINAFQAQPDATDWWQSNHPDLLLRSSGGSLVIDQNWGEALLDVSTGAKQAELAQIEYGWIDSCAKKGFQAIEPDNLDSYSRSNGLLTMDENAAFATLLARHAHTDGLAIGQKNTTDLLSRHQQIGFDFAVSEQCGTYDECDQYAAAYADHVLDIEYDDDGLSSACDAWAGKISIVERDNDVSPQGDSAYVYKTC